MPASEYVGARRARLVIAEEFRRGTFPRVTGRLALAFTPLPGAVPVDSETYSLWLLPGQRRFFLLRYLPSQPSEAGRLQPTSHRP